MRRTPTAAVDLFSVATNSGHVLITPASGRGRLALLQLLDSSMPRVGDAWLLRAEQEEAVCGFLRSLRLSLRRWTHRPFAATPGCHSAAPEQPPAGGTTHLFTPLIPASIPMSTISVAPTEPITAPPPAASPSAAPLPAWVVPATPEIDRTVVGISPNGVLYIYGETPDRPGPLVPAIVGVVTDLRVSQHGVNSRYGLRDYLDLQLGTPIASLEVILRLPCKANHPPGGGDPLIPWSVRSLLGALQAVDLPNTALKLQTRRGNSATFFRVIPFCAAGMEQAEIRSAAIGGGRDDLEIAVNHLRAQLELPPFFPEPVKDSAR